MYVAPLNLLRIVTDQVFFRSKMLLEMSMAGPRTSWVKKEWHSRLMQMLHLTYVLKISSQVKV